MANSNEIVDQTKYAQRMAYKQNLLLSQRKCNTDSFRYGTRKLTCAFTKEFHIGAVCVDSE